jgi:hypothetical protein
MSLKKYAVPLLSVGSAAILIALFSRFGLWPGLSLSVQPLTVMNVMAPLLLTAAFIERAVEVVITPWRDPGWDELTDALAIVKANPAATPADKASAIKALDDYQDLTKQYAFATALLLGLAAAMVGVRALWPFLDAPAMVLFNAASKSQQGSFIVVDVVLSAALLAGGANGIHSVVNAFTTFFDTNAQKATKNANA